ncbi:uncharacterized protein LOC124112892 [Haliotis rufescens]|uniref:uncharacterized protein LOC124112892 n=1 Tax=Haliotis rufescens TaxID=6454 RepID=UPI00201E974D|nr:uncharacterized protein LOC124112892 [Haliotis rufescens]
MVYVPALLGLLLTAASYVTAQTACVAGMRSLLTNTSAYWFGTRYETDCPPGNVGLWCRSNREPSRTSLLTRLMGDGATDPSGLAFVINVRYPNTLPVDGSDRTYPGCGRIVEAPLKRPEHFCINPLCNSVYSPFDLREEPGVTWPAEQNALYTVMMYDPGPFFMHALYVNVTGGRLQNGDTIFPYIGPGNPFDRVNPYLWLVFKQQRPLDVSLIPSVRNEIYLEELISQLGLSTQSYGINVAMTKTDEYAAVFLRSVGFLNRCPAYYGQWLSNYIQERGGLPSLPACLDLSVSIDVGFTAPAITYTSCGTVYQKSPVNVTVDYRNMDLLGAVETRNSPQVSLVPLAIRGQPPSVTLRDKLYTLLMYDPTEELGQTDQNAYVHWMVVNIRGTDITSGDEVYDWLLPMTSTLNQLYLFALFEQRASIRTRRAGSFGGTDCHPYIPRRCKFRAGDFIRKNNLSLVGLRHLRVVPDTYRQYMAYAVTKLQTRDQACWGQVGERPQCPIG